MRWAVLIMIVALTGLAPAYPQSEPDTLRVLSLNLRGLLSDGDDLSFDTVRTEWLLEALLELDPDLVGFQEILQSRDAGGTDNQLAVLADSLEARTGRRYFFDTLMTHDSWGIYREGIGILSKHPVLDSRSYLLDDVGVFQRGLIGAAVNTPLGLVNFYSTHLAYRSDHENVRVGQVSQIKQTVNRAAAFSVASIVAGDFNASPDSPSIRRAMDDNPRSFVDSYSDTSQPGFTYPVYAPESRIDYVFVLEGTSLEVIDSTPVLGDTRAGRHLSDHLGVLAILVKP